MLVVNGGIYMKKKLFKIQIMSVVAFLTIQGSIYADLDHVCAYSNESVVKFREKIAPICAIENIIGKSKIAFSWPVDLCEFWVSSLFGPRRHQGITKHHGGVDMAALKGTSVRASASGTVKVVTPNAPGYGNLIEIVHKNGFMTRYGHLNQMHAQVGDKVARGDSIATVGSTGNARGKDPSHLHFEILKDGKRIDPLPYLYCSEIEFKK
jgi:murein DD-endopeptidase MepM/ murein hydrolase activator NlpD